MLKITRDDNPKSEDIQILNDGIIEYAKQQRDHKPFRPFSFFIRDEKGNIKGGCNGVILYGCLHVDSLWVHESLRGQGFGKQLMAEIEKTAQENNCPFVTVFTMDWEALDFYKKIGFYVEFERHGYDKKSMKNILCKRPSH